MSETRRELTAAPCALRHSQDVCAFWSAFAATCRQAHGRHDDILAGTGSRMLVKLSSYSFTTGPLGATGSRLWPQNIRMGTSTATNASQRKTATSVEGSEVSVGCTSRASGANSTPVPTTNGESPRPTRP